MIASAFEQVVVMGDVPRVVTFGEDEGREFVATLEGGCLCGNGDFKVERTGYCDELRVVSCENCGWTAQVEDRRKA